MTPTDPPASDYIGWGDISSFAGGESIWASFRHDAIVMCLDQSGDG